MASVNRASSADSGERSVPGTTLVSYTGPDQLWAEWIADELRRAGGTVELAEWESARDAGLLNVLRRAQDDGHRHLVAVLSGTYLEAALSSDADGAESAEWSTSQHVTLVPVMVRRCALPTRFWPLNPTFLHEITDEQEARGRLFTRLLGRHPAPGESYPVTRYPGRRPDVWSPRIPSRNPYFIGRDAMLRELRRKLTADVTALTPHSLRGLGGVGKSQLAIEYAHRFAADYDLVWWIPADEPASTRESLAALARYLDLGGPFADTGELVRSALNALRTGQPYQRWLLIFDNAEQPDSIRDLLLDGPGHSLITSRDQSWDRQADILDVNVYERAESLALLQRRVPRLTEKEADSLAEELGDLPLALEHAVSWLSTTRRPADDYLIELRERAADLLSTLRPAGYPAEVAVTYAISMNLLREQAPGAAQMLELCAFIGPAPINLSLLTDAPPDLLPEPLRTEIQAERAQTTMLQAIQAYSLALIEPQPGQPPTLQQHRLVQAVIRDMLVPGRREEYRATAHEILAAVDPGDPRDIASWPRYAALLPHVLASGAADSDAPAARRLVLRHARLLTITGEYQTSLGLIERALATWAPRLDPVDEDMVSARAERVMALRGLSRLREALELSQADYDLTRDTLGEDHAYTLQIASGLAATHRRLGNFAAARELDQFALDTHTQRYGPEHRQTLQTAHNVALNHRLSGEFRTALEIDRHNAEAYERLAGPDSLHTLFSRNNIARDLRECGEYYESLTLQEEVCAQYRELYGEQNPESLRAMKNLAVSRRKAGRYDESLQLATDVLAGHHQKFGDQHMETLAATTNLANDYRCLGQYPQGKSYAEIAVWNFAVTLGDDNVMTAFAKVNLAVLLRRTGDPAAARRLNSEALTILRRMLGDDHRYTLTCRVNLASDLALLDELEAARETDTDALARLRRVCGENHPYTLSCALNLALDLRGLEERARYRELLADVLERYRRTLGDSHPEARLAAARSRADCDIEPPPV